MASLAIRNPPDQIGSASRDVSVITETFGDGLFGHSKPSGSDWKRSQRGLRDHGDLWRWPLWPLEALRIGSEALPERSP